MDQPLAIVTGASSGIGEAIARAFAARRWRTVLIARRAELLRDLAARLQPLAPSHWEALDLCDADTLAPALDRIVAAHGAPAALINNAGYGLYKPFLEHTEADLERLMRIHYFAPACAVRAVLPHMRTRPPDHANLRAARAHVFNIASISVKIGPWGHSGYAAAKSALRALTQSLAAEHAKDAVRFTVVCPGIIDTPYFQADGYAQFYERIARRAIPAQRVADAVMRALGSTAVEICVPRHYRALDLLTALSPRLAHRIVARQSSPP